MIQMRYFVVILLHLLCISCFTVRTRSLISQHTRPLRTMGLYVAPKASGIATTREGKSAILSRAQMLLNTSAFVALFPVDGVSKEQIDMLKKELPDSVKASVFKNSIFKIAIKGTKFEQLSEYSKNENIYLFVPEGSSAATLEKFLAWQKDMKRIRLEEGIKAVGIENQAFTGLDIPPILRIPSKSDLLLRLIGSLKSVGERLLGSLHEIKAMLERANSSSQESPADSLISTSNSQPAATSTSDVITIPPSSPQ